MKYWIAFLLVISPFFSAFAQEDIYVDLKIMVGEQQSQHSSTKAYTVVFFIESDSIKINTDQNGILEISTRDAFQIIELNRAYTIAIYDGKKHLGNDTFSTYTDETTRIIRHLKPYELECNKTYYPIQFKNGTTDFSNDGKRNFERLSIFLEENETVILEIYGEFNAVISSSLASNRANKVRDSLIQDGHFANRLRIAKPAKTDSTNAHVGFRIASFNYTPCTATQGLVVNFDKATNAIVETNCDSIQFLYNYIKANPTENFVIIGIVTNRKDERNKVNERTDRIRLRLIEMGIQENRLTTSTSYFKPPGENDHHDWPFYPDSFTFEIGAYMQIDY